jgi:hypothetical protein
VTVSLNDIGIEVAMADRRVQEIKVAVYVTHIEAVVIIAIEAFQGDFPNSSQILSFP